MIFIFDLDGTLIDSSERMYKLFCELVPECKLSKNEYWDYKRDKVNHKALLERLYPQYSFESFNAAWMSKIEDEDYLCLDCSYQDTEEVLKKLKDRGRSLFLLTARQSKQGLMNELSRLGLINFFEKILTTEGLCSKEDVLLEYSNENPSILDKDNYFVSDMGKDITLAKKYGYSTIGISHGFMSRKRLTEYCPDILIDELSELLSVICH